MPKIGTYPGGSALTGAEVLVAVQSGASVKLTPDQFKQLIKNPRYLTVSATAVAGDFISADTTGGAITITLPITPTANQLVSVYDFGGNAATENITIGRNGETIDGLAEDFIIDENYGRVDLIYDGADWKISIVTPGAGLTEAQVDLRIEEDRTNTLSMATGDETGWDFDLTVNKATSGNYTGLKLNVTETSAPGTNDKLLDLQVGGVSKASIDNDGVLKVNHRITLDDTNSPNTYITSASNGHSIRFYTRYDSGHPQLELTQSNVGVLADSGLRIAPNLNSASYGLVFTTSVASPAQINGGGMINPFWIAPPYGQDATTAVNRHAVDFNISVGSGGTPTSGVTTGGDAGTFIISLGAKGLGFGGGADGADGKFQIQNAASSNLLEIQQEGAIGFFAATPVSQQNVPLTGASVQDVIDALVALGLVEQSDP